MPRGRKRKVIEVPAVEVAVVAAPAAAEVPAPELQHGTSVARVKKRKKRARKAEQAQLVAAPLPSMPELDDPPELEQPALPRLIIELQPQVGNERKHGHKHKHKSKKSKKSKKHSKKKSLEPCYKVYTCELVEEHGAMDTEEVEQVDLDAELLVHDGPPQQEEPVIEPGPPANGSILEQLLTKKPRHKSKDHQNRHKHHRHHHHRHHRQQPDEASNSLAAITSSSAVSSSSSNSLNSNHSNQWHGKKKRILEQWQMDLTPKTNEDDDNDDSNQ